MKPILFSTEMVNAILEGRKTMTRRVIKDKGIINSWDCERDGTPIAYMDPPTGDAYPPTAPANYQPGDILWVRETWQYAYDIDNNTDQPIYETGRYLYRADGEMPFTHWVDTESGEYKEKMPWKPSIHMPKDAARILLRVTDVKVERLQDITEEGAEREGAKAYGPNNCSGVSARIAFAELWDNLYKKGSFEWRKNPWVWAYTFERIPAKEAEL